MIMRAHYDWPCPFCGIVCTSRRKLYQHKIDVHPIERLKPPPGGTCKFCGKYVQYKATLHMHEDRCVNNPHRVAWKGHPCTEQIKQKIRNASKTNKRMGGYRKGSGRGKKGSYQGYYCDSSWELAYVIYNLEHGIRFTRNKERFEYKFNGKIRKYLPDFCVDDKYIEIKGYVSKQWLAKKEQFPYQDRLIVIDEDGIQQYINYVTEKYGSNYTRLYEKAT